MAKRTEIFTTEALDGLYFHHPYLLLFQKEDWKDYLILFAHIYDFLEEENIRAPYEVLRTLVIKFYAPRKLLNLEQKIFQFFQMAIGELQILKDSHDQFGQRFIETTRSGKMLLQMVESLLERRVRFSGTGAEALLGALNDILSSRQQMTKEDAIRHHKEKIKAYQADIQRIQIAGLTHAELLPIPHSNEALFNQAEEAAIHILSSIEDVKTAIERQRQELAQGYFEGTRTAGQSLAAAAEFYERLYSSPEYISYNQAKALLSHLDGYAARFVMRNVDHLLYRIREKELLPGDELQKSHLQGFMDQFQNADHSIQEKVKAQIRLLQQQVHYAVNTDVQGLQSSLHGVLSQMLAQKKGLTGFFEAEPVEIVIPTEFDNGSIELSEFQIPPEVRGAALEDAVLEEDEKRALFLALLQAEETTLKTILGRVRSRLGEVAELDIADYSFEHGLAEYYVLSEIEIFDPAIEKRQFGKVDLLMPTKFGLYVMRHVPRFKYTLKEGSYGVQ